ncbi:parallel beta helix pectate lyase-like protein [Anseongella ginsenosidimutans]|uniref:Parallel beta helix pectate lyase-like protein n=1 Tax=Anseongella ginsenosidimutans TaxID=496056 RepID=A0A4R3KS45_9SPHI|nr:right-handed parallel beta-helix repeat-containing protein [Anseongella ginsenosidimutans]QEC52942.1 right-handed parallel beta-helix repeat-containing protein [Anseongella ginsenosidimutans]TCS87337.1 parallel beta helix pectate lyase-like protein [Anseongella ginsenosidimutans]
MNKILPLFAGCFFIYLLAGFNVRTNPVPLEKEITYYVSARGNDSGQGTKKLPFKTIQKARDVIRQLPADNRPSVTVLIQGGTYYLQHPVIFNKEDAGTESAPVIYKAVKGETPVFTGSVALDNWEPVKDQEVLQHVNPEIRRKLYVRDLAAAGITNYGDPAEKGRRPALYCNQQLQTLARWPNKGFTRSGKAKGKTPLPEVWTGEKGTKEGIFEYLDERIDKWATSPDIRLGGYWFWDWSEQYHEVERIDAGANTIYIRQPYHGYGYKDQLNFFGMNILSELDQPGEWYLDRRKGKLYWYPPVDMASSPTVSLTIYDQPYMVEMNDASYLQIEGLYFQESRGSGILIKGGSRNLVKNCSVERLGTDGIHIEGGSHHGVSGTYLGHLGYSGLRVIGGDRATLEPGGHYVEHCIVEHFSLFKRTYEPAVYMQGCGNSIRHNRFQYSSSSAMRLEGNDFLVEFNEIGHVVNESDDQGGLDAWYNPTYRGNIIRYNYWHDITGGSHAGAAGVRLDDMISGYTVYGNIFERCGSKNFGGVQIHGGKDNIIDNNLFLDCQYAVSFTLWGKDRWLRELDKPQMKKKLYEEVDITSPAYMQKYPELARLKENADVNILRNNLAIGAKSLFKNGQDQVAAGNHLISREEKKELSDYLSPRFLKSYGLQPIPFDKIGPQKKQ